MAEELGDCKPTQLLRKMQQLLSGRKPIDNSLLRELFLQRLSSNVQMILASADDMDIGKLTEMADRIMDAGTPTVTAVSTSTEDDHIRKIFHKEVNKQHRSRPRSLSNSNRESRNRSRRRFTSRGRSFNRQVKQNDVCWYHMQFDENARKCRPPCSAGTPRPAASGDQHGWPTNRSPSLCHRSGIQATLFCRYQFGGEHHTSL